MRQPEAEEKGRNQEVPSELPAHARLIAGDKTRPTASLVAKRQGEQNCGNHNGHGVGRIAHIGGELADGEEFHRENSVALDGNRTKEQRGREHRSLQPLGEPVDIRKMHRRSKPNGSGSGTMSVAVALPRTFINTHRDDNHYVRHIAGGVAHTLSGWLCPLAHLAGVSPTFVTPKAKAGALSC